MIADDRRRHVAAVAASLLLHAFALGAVEMRGSAPPVVVSSAETVLEVALWSGDDGEGGVAAEPTSSVAGPVVAEAPAADEVSWSSVEEDETLSPPAPIAPPVEPPSDIVSSAPPADHPAIVGEAETVAERPPDPVDRSVSETDRRDRAVAAGRPDDRPRKDRSKRRDLREPPAKRLSRARSRDRAAAVAGPSSETADEGGRRGRAPSAIAGRPGAPGPRGAGGSASDLSRYLARVRARIASRQAALGGERGRVGIRFVVAGDGGFGDLAVVAGDRGPLADAALRVVRRGSPAPPIPPQLGRDRIAVTVTIVFD